MLLYNNMLEFRQQKQASKQCFEDFIIQNDLTPPLAYQCSAYCQSQWKYGLAMLTYVIQAVLINPNGTPITWPSFLMLPTYLNLMKQIDRSVLGSFTFITKGDKIVLLYKTNRLKINMHTSFKMEVEQVNYSEAINRNQLIQENRKELNPDIRSSFEKIVDSINKCWYNNMAIARNHTPSFTKLLPSLDSKLKVSKNLKQLSLRLKLFENISSILENQYEIEARNICQPNMNLHLKIPSQLRYLNKSTSNNSKRNQLKQTINRELTYILNLLLNNKQTQSSNLYQIYGESNLKEVCCSELVGGVSEVKKMQTQHMKCTDKRQMQKGEVKQLYDIELARKTPRQTQDIKHKANNLKRFYHQLEIVRQINENTHNKFYMLNYFEEAHNCSVYYAEWVDMSLTNYLDKYYSLLTIEDMLILGIQVVLIVMDLHRCGVVHRDLKPSNFLVQTSGKKFPILKLVDFSDSIAINGGDKEVISGNLKVFSTPAYCPLESSIFHVDYLKQGLKNPEIDYWSVGVILYEIFNNKIPISYSTSTTKDIHALWTYEFNENISLYRNINMPNILNIINILTSQLVRIKQADRISLEKVLAGLLISYSYFKNIKEIFE